ncbi:MAG: serine/threonine-protein kinase [Deferrisomatales bacterium]|nr:serine/threonine-protein kinase [Deferrisomatales bacterium]
MEGALAIAETAATASARGLLRFATAMFRSTIAFPKLWWRPKLLLLWLFRAHLAQALLVASLLLMPQIVPRATDRLLEKIYPPVSTKLLGLLPVRQAHPKLDRRKGQLRWALRYGSGALVFWAFWVSIPAAIRRGECIARSYEGRADALLHSTPSASVVLYRRALTFTSDSDHGTAIRGKLDKLDRRVAGSRPPVAATSVMDPGGRTGSQEQGLGGQGQRYVIEKELGRGGMGVVLLAHDTVLERKVAIKQLPHTVANDVPHSERFRREAQALARLNHPGIVQVYDFAQFQGSAWIIMEYVEGAELESLAARTGIMDPAEVVRLGRAMAAALQCAHDNGVLHRDLKPTNVLVDGQGNPKVMDFGVARLAMSDTHTRPGTVLGSPAYMSPEQARGAGVDERTDIYALGVILYELLAGEKLFDGTLEEVIAQVLGRVPAPICDVTGGLPPRLSQLVMSMVAKDPEQRPATMAAVQAQLGELHVGDAKGTITIGGAEGT